MTGLLHRYLAQEIGNYRFWTNDIQIHTRGNQFQILLKDDDITQLLGRLGIEERKILFDVINSIRNG